MRLLTISLTAYGAAIALSLSPWSQADAQDAPSEVAATPAPAHGDWTLRQREEWLNDRLDKSRDNGALDQMEYDRAKHSMDALRGDEDRMRDEQHGQLTDNENADLEARLARL